MLLLRPMICERSFVSLCQRTYLGSVKLSKSETLAGAGDPVADKQYSKKATFRGPELGRGGC